MSALERRARPSGVGTAKPQRRSLSPILSPRLLPEGKPAAASFESSRRPAFIPAPVATTSVRTERSSSGSSSRPSNSVERLLSAMTVGRGASAGRGSTEVSAERSSEWSGEESSERPVNSGLEVLKSAAERSSRSASRSSFERNGGGSPRLDHGGVCRKVIEFTGLPLNMIIVRNAESGRMEVISASGQAAAKVPTARRPPYPPPPPAPSLPSPPSSRPPRACGLGTWSPSSMGRACWRGCTTTASSSSLAAPSSRSASPFGARARGAATWIRLCSGAGVAPWSQWCRRQSRC